MTSMLPPSHPPPVVLLVNSSALPPGKICGQRWETSPCASCVTRLGAPPADGIRHRPPPGLSAAMMLPSSPQLAPMNAPAVHKVTGEPPSTEIFLTFPLAINATHWPSGENTGAIAPPVPASSTALG